MSKKFAQVALAGLPNAGKSTLLNRLVGQKIAIVTPKVQTTRYNTKGIVNFDNTQIVFVDTPGLFEPSQKLEKWIARSAWQGIYDSDIVCFIIDPKSNVLERIVPLKDRIKESGKPCIAVVNKIDLVHDKKTLLGFLKSLEELEIFESFFMISALRNDGIKRVIDHLKQNAKESPWMFDDGIVTDRTEREIAEEITRETMYMLLSEELPYSIEVKTEMWEEQKDGSVKIHHVIHVLKESQKTIIIGKQGAKIKDIGQRSRKNISHMLGKPVHLYLYVKVKEDWINEIS